MSLRVGEVYKVTEGGYGGRKYRIDSVSEGRVRVTHGWWRWKKKPTPQDPWHWSGAVHAYDVSFFASARGLGKPPAEGDKRSEYEWGMAELDNAWGR